ncbi:MAG: hypothetical protein IPM57_10700 [Oligoflexia bacterium]|nr:hypothetical protein [Oligoflexia bacterium]
MNDKVEVKKSNLTHVALTLESLSKIKGWQEQLRIKKEGMQLTYKDLINWLIASSPDNLTASETKALIENFYDEESYYRKKLRELKKEKLILKQSAQELSQE